MSWTDPCGNCDQHRADCDCRDYACVKSHTCEYCKHECKNKLVNGKKVKTCANFRLAKK